MTDSNQRAAAPRLQRVAREARKLAMECVEGTAPHLGHFAFWHNGPVCALGHVVARAGAKNEPQALDMYADLPVEERIAVMNGNDRALNDERHGSVVFPLLWLADAIEDASKTPKENP